MPQANEYLKGTKVWISSIENVWEIAIIMEDYTVIETEIETQLVVQTQEFQETKILSIRSNSDLPPICSCEDISDNAKNNLTSLITLDEASILNTLRERFERRCIYTYCGITILILNPYVKLCNNETDKILSYRKQAIDTHEVHIFSAAEKVYSRLKRENCDQSIVFTGITGAGKTENAEHVILYLLTTSTNERQIKERILSSSTVLQAFGNAKTIKNSNSSRFGKFIELQYDKSYNIIGASLKTYLLDRSKIAFEELSEPTFHIFYQMFAAKYRLSHLLLDDQEFSYLHRLFETETDCEKNLLGFDATMNALTVLGFSIKQQDEILRIISAILHLGNLKFQKLDCGEINYNAESCFIPDLSPLQASLKLFGVNPKTINVSRKWMCHKRIISAQDEILQPMTADQAVKARDALIKFIYTKLFSWIITKMNASFRSPCNVQSFIGVLDIYGFENLNINSFEQFCINYANEKLQQYFVHVFFKLEQEEYLREEIDWRSIDFEDNKLLVELIEGKGGIIDIIDDETKILKDSSKKWLESLHSKCEKMKYLEISETNTEYFIIRHFIEEIKYDSNEFLEKNKDSIIREQLEILKESKNDLLNKLLLAEYSKLATTKGNKNCAAHKRVSVINKPIKKTVISEFRSSMLALTSTLNKTTPYYVRCIKSNDERKPFEFNSLCIVNQLRAFSILETIQLSKAGYFHQKSYEKFFQRYHCLCAFGHIIRDDLQETCKIILSKTIEGSDEIKFGKTKVFLRENSINQLEKCRAEKQHNASITIQKTVRRFLQQKKYLQIRQNICNLQRRFRAIQQERILRKQQALQSFFKVDSEDSKEKIAQVQAMEAAIVDIQRLARGYLVRRKCADKLRNIVIVQSTVRRFLAKIIVEKMKKDRDEHIELLNKGLKSKFNLLQQKIDHFMARQPSLVELEKSNTLVNDVQLKNKMLNQLLFDKIQSLKELRGRQENACIPQLECKNNNLQDGNGKTDNQSLCGMFQSLLNEDGDYRSYQALLHSYYKFDERAKILKQELGLEQSDIDQLRTLIKNSEISARSSDDCEKFDDSNHNAGDEGSEKECDTNSQKEISPVSSSNMISDHYEGMIVFAVEDVDTIISHLMTELNTSTTINLYPELPAQILFMCIRYADSINNSSMVFSLLQSYLKTVRHVIKQNKRFELIVLWMVNTHRLLNYMKQYSKANSKNCKRFHIENTDQQKKKQVLNLDLTIYWEAIHEAGQWMFKKAVKQMKNGTLEYVVPALIDNDKIDKFLTSDEDQNLVYNKLGLLIKKFTIFLDILNKFQVDKRITVLMFKRLFDFVSSIVLSNITSRIELCRSSKGLLMRCNLRNIEQWASKHLLLPAIESLRPVIQATRLLQMQPIEVDDVEMICKNYNKLNYIQIIKILNSYSTNDDCDNPLSEGLIRNLQYKLMERESLDDTIIIDKDSYSIPFLFQYSPTNFEEVEIPEVFNLPMLKRI